MNKKLKSPNPQPKKVTPASTKYIRSKIILMGIIIVLGLILVIDSKTGFIKAIVGDGTIRIPIPHWLKKLIG